MQVRPPGFPKIWLSRQGRSMMPPHSNFTKNESQFDANYFSGGPKTIFMMIQQLEDVGLQKPQMRISTVGREEALGVIWQRFLRDFQQGEARPLHSPRNKEIAQSWLGLWRQGKNKNKGTLAIPLPNSQVTPNWWYPTIRTKKPPNFPHHVFLPFFHFFPPYPFYSLLEEPRSRVVKFHTQKDGDMIWSIL